MPERWEQSWAAEDGAGPPVTVPADRAESPSSRLQRSEVSVRREAGALGDAPGSHPPGGRGVRLRELLGGLCEPVSEAWTWVKIPVGSPGAPQHCRRDPNTLLPACQRDSHEPGPLSLTECRKTVSKRGEMGPILILL